MSKKVKKSAPRDLKRNQVITTDEWDFVVSEQGKTYFVKKSKIGEYKGNTEFATALVGKGYTKGKLSDGTDIIYPTNDLEESKTEVQRIEVTPKLAYVAYASCKEAKRQGKEVSFTTALTYYASHPEDVEKAADVLIGKKLDDQNQIVVWKPNFTLVEDIAKTIDDEKSDFIAVDTFVSNSVSPAFDGKVEDITGTTDTTGSNGTTDDSSNKKKKAKLTLKKTIAGVVTIVMLAGVAFGIAYGISQSKDPSTPIVAVKDHEESIENLLDGRFLHYEVRNDYLYICENVNDGASVTFARLKLDQNYPSADNLTNEQKNNIANYIDKEENKAKLETLATLNTRSGREIKIARENDGETKTVILNQITKGANPFNKNAEDGTITIIGTPSVAFNRNSETTYRTTVDVYEFSKFDEDGNMTSKHYTIYSDCARDASEEEQYKLLSESINVSSTTLMEDYSPAGLFIGKQMQVKTNAPSTADDVITDGEYSSEQRDLYKSGILKSTERIKGQVAEANGVKYYLVENTADKKGSSYLYAVKYDSFGDIESSRKYIDAKNISGDSKGIKLVSSLINNQTWDKPIYVELLPAEQNDAGKIVSHLNIVSFRYDEADKVYEVNALNDAVKMTSDSKEYSQAEMLAMYIAKTKGGYVSVGTDQRSFSTKVITQIAKAPAESENDGTYTTGLSK